MGLDILIYHYYGIEGVYTSWIAGFVIFIAVVAIGMLGKWRGWW